MVRKIIIFGGGTSGWLTAAYLTNNLAEPVEIQLIEDASKGPIGVGEGTQPLTASFLYKCGITAKDWMKPSNASFKYGVELTGWNDKPYFVDNDTVNNVVPAPHIPVSKYFIDKPYSEFAKWHPAYRLAKSNTATKLDSEIDVNFNVGLDSYGAVHFSAYDIIDTIKKLILDRINYVDTKIVQVGTDVSGITKLIDADGKEYAGDLYIDCSGFQSILLGKTLKEDFISYNKWLLNDSAVAIPTQYTNPEEECFPYTKATTMNAGWRWTIPTYHRVGNGYVYSSKHITPEEAEAELREPIGEYDAPANHLKMRIGSYKNIAVKNVVGVGLAAGFIEPLEATGITFTTALVTSLAELLNLSGNQWTEQPQAMINRGFYEMNVEILTFIFAHYYFSTRNDTPYWQDVRKQRIEDLPDDARMILSQYYPYPKDFIFFSPNSMFNSVQWWSMLHAGGAYPNARCDLTDEQKKYIEHFMKVQDVRVDSSKELFGNHYEFLKKWYKEWQE